MKTIYRCPLSFASEDDISESLSTNVRKLPLVPIFISLTQDTHKDMVVIRGVESVQLESLPENGTRSLIGFSNVVKEMWLGQQTFVGSSDRATGFFSSCGGILR